MRGPYILVTWQTVLLKLQSSQLMLLLALLGCADVTPTISIWQESPLKLQYVEPIVLAISLSASTKQHPQSKKHHMSNQCLQLCLCKTMAISLRCSVFWLHELKNLY